MPETDMPGICYDLHSSRFYCIIRNRAKSTGNYHSHIPLNRSAVPVRRVGAYREGPLADVEAKPKGGYLL